MFVNDYGGSVEDDIDGVMNADRTVTGTLKSNSITCSIQISTQDSPHSTSINGGSVDDSGIIPLSPGEKGAKFKTDCSIAAFGATAHMATAFSEESKKVQQDKDDSTSSNEEERKASQQVLLRDDSVYVRAPLLIPNDDPTGCDGTTLKPPDKNQKQESEMHSDKQNSDQKQHVHSDEDDNSQPWSPITWLKDNAFNLFGGNVDNTNNDDHHKSNCGDGDGDGDDDDDDSDSDGDGNCGGVYSDQIVMAKRGQCLFEDKAFNAQNKGAIGSVIVNHEETKFVMAGSSAVVEHVQSSSPKLPSSTLSIPSVMISKKEGQILESTINHLRAK